MHLLLLLALAEPRLVAVLEFKNKLGAAADASYLADSVRTAALDAGVKVMTRENMLVLLKSSGRKLEDCEGECEVDTGRRLGADMVVSGEVLKFGSRFKLDLRMHETSSGQLISGVQASGKSLDELDDAIPVAVKKLFRPLVEAPAAASPAPAAAAKTADSSGDASLPDSLDRGMVEAGLAQVKSSVALCANVSKAKGRVKLHVKVAGDGHVSSVEVTQTPDPALGSCAVAAMRKAVFPRTRNGGGFSYPYSF